MSPLLEDLALVALTRYWRTVRCGCRGPECVPRQGLRIRLVGLTGGKILLAHDY
jgi:hypothetical protein